MKGLVLKDLLVISKMSKTYIMMILIYLVLGLLLKNIYVITGLTVVMPIMITLSTVTYDDYSKFNRFALCNGISRNDLVSSKYLLVLIISLIMMVISVISLFIASFDYNLSLINNIKVNSAEIIIVTSMLSCLVLMSMFITLPIVFKFGSEKGRFYSAIAYLIPLLLIFGSINFIKDINNNVMAIVGIIVLIILVIFFVSFNISKKIVNNKDF